METVVLTLLSIVFGFAWTIWRIGSIDLADMKAQRQSRLDPMQRALLPEIIMTIGATLIFEYLMSKYLPNLSFVITVGLLISLTPLFGIKAYKINEEIKSKLP